MNTKIISLIATGILLSQASYAQRCPNHSNDTFHIPAYYTHGAIVANSPPSSPLIMVHQNINFSSTLNPYPGGVYDSWYQNKVWAPGYTIVRGNHAEWIPGGWVYRQ